MVETLTQFTLAKVTERELITRYQTDINNLQQVQPLTQFPHSNPMQLGCACIDTNLLVRFASMSLSKRSYFFWFFFCKFTRLGNPKQDGLPAFETDSNGYLMMPRVINRTHWVPPADQSKYYVVGSVFCHGLRRF